MQSLMLTTTGNDGWKDLSADNAKQPLRGTLSRFTEGQIVTTDGRVLNGRKLCAIGTLRAQVVWKDKRPVEYHFRKPGQEMPARADVGHTDQDEWEVGPDGERKDPVADTCFLHLMDPQSAELFTFSTSSWGGRGAVGELADQIMRMRCGRSGAVPLVELGSAPMQTRYGRKSKPKFTVVDWLDATGKAFNENATEAGKVLDDEVPF
jgi:hypothetical protein